MRQQGRCSNCRVRGLECIFLPVPSSNQARTVRRSGPYPTFSTGHLDSRYLPALERMLHNPIPPFNETFTDNRPLITGEYFHQHRAPYPSLFLPGQQTFVSHNVVGTTWQSPPDCTGSTSNGVAGRESAVLDIDRDMLYRLKGNGQ